MFNLSGTTGSDHRDGYIVPDVVDQFNVKTAIGTVLINAVDLADFYRRWASNPVQDYNCLPPGLLTWQYFSVLYVRFPVF